MKQSVGKSTPNKAPSPLVMMIGHSTHTLEEFIRLLQAHGATYVVDVRTVPRSRHNHLFKMFWDEERSKYALAVCRTALMALGFTLTDLTPIEIRRETFFGSLASSPHNERCLPRRRGVR